MVALARRFGRYRPYAQHEQIELDIGPGLTPRHDSVANFLRRGGLSGSDEPLNVLVRRTSYFREEYAYGTTVLAPGIEVFLYHQGLVDAAAAVHGRPLIEPAIAYANLLVPGQELAVHTDVPEFRGLDRKLVPQWLLVVMHHSGLFDRWRLHIATGVAWFGDAAGGEFVCWPPGHADLRGPGERIPARHGTAAVLDTDSVFHGVARVGGEDAPAPQLRAGCELHAAAADGWDLVTTDGALCGHFAADEVRFSISWKAYCFADATERAAWQDHSDDLAVDTVLDRLAADLEHRTGAADLRTSPALGQRLIDTYIRFPEPADG
ncbi:MAG: hypothetical protein JWN46_2644 [Acidimicrobiales bacterium]|nr:hypothetical protein [Acidimicrobiales bacterium]